MDQNPAISIGLKLVELFGEKISQAINKSQKTVLRFGMQVGLLTCDGRFVMNDLKANNLLYGRENQLSHWETFTIVDPKDPHVSQLDRRIHYNDNIALKAENSNTFVMANLDNNYELIAKVPHVGSWEKFILMAVEDGTLRRNVVCYGNSINLRAYNGRYVMYNMDGDHLLSAVAERPSKWEKFFLICPDSFK